MSNLILSSGIHFNPFHKFVEGSYNLGPSHCSLSKSFHKPLLSMKTKRCLSFLAQGTCL